MGDQAADDGSASARARAVARLTTLQRLREDALAKNRQAMLRSIEDMIAAELRALDAHRPHDAAAGESRTDAPRG